MAKDLHVAIVDGKKIQIESMQSLINQRIKKIDLTVNLIDFSSGEDFIKLENYFRIGSHSEMIFYNWKKLHFKV